MNKSLPKNIGFDVLLKSSASGGMPSLNNIEQFKPPQENIAKCNRWLTSKGVTCHATDFGLACSAPAELFETLFSTKVKYTRSSPGAPCWHSTSHIKVPLEIAEYIDQISISAPPEFFSIKPIKG